MTDYRTVTVVGSSTALRLDGTTALVLHTREMGAISFRVDQQAIDTLQAQLASAEAFLRQLALSATGMRLVSKR